MTDWCPIDADNAKIYLAKEVVEGTHSTVGAEQIHPLSGAHGDGHEPVRRPPHPGGRQKIKLDSEQPGPLNPEVQLTMPLRYDDLELLMEAVLGGASALGAWPIGAGLPSYSIGINDTVNYWKYSGSKVRTATLTSAPGTTADLALDFGCLLLEEAAPAAYDALLLTTSPTNAPYLWEELTVDGGGAPGPTSDVKPESLSLTIGNGLLLKREPGNRYPGCQEAGRLEVEGTMAFPFSTEFHASLQSFVNAYSQFYLKWRFTNAVTSDFFDLELPCSLVVPTRTIPEGSTPMQSDLSFFAHADDFILTTPTVEATSTTF